MFESRCLILRCLEVKSSFHTALKKLAKYALRAVLCSVQALTLSRSLRWMWVRVRDLLIPKIKPKSVLTACCNMLSEHKGVFNLRPPLWLEGVLAWSVLTINRLSESSHCALLNHIQMVAIHWLAHFQFDRCTPDVIWQMKAQTIVFTDLTLYLPHCYIDCRLSSRTGNVSFVALNRNKQGAWIL